MRHNRIRTLKKHINIKPPTKQPTTKKQIGGAAMNSSSSVKNSSQQKAKRPKAKRPRSAAVVSDGEEEEEEAVEAVEAAAAEEAAAAAADRQALIYYVNSEEHKAGTTPIIIDNILENVPKDSIIYSALQERIREQYKYIDNSDHIDIFILHALFNEYYTPPPIEISIERQRPIYRLLTNKKNNIEVNYTLNSKYNFKYNDNYDNETINLMSSIMKGASYFNIEYLNLFKDYNIEPTGGGGGAAADGGGGDMSNDVSVNVPNDYLKFINSIMINIRHIEFILYSLPSDYIIEQNKPPYYLYHSYIFLLNILIKKNIQTEPSKQMLENITDIILADPNIYNLQAVFIKPPNMDALFEGKHSLLYISDLHNHIDKVILSLLTPASAAAASKAAEEAADMFKTL
jgi:hypothetical protein